MFCNYAWLELPGPILDHCLGASPGFSRHFQVLNGQDHPLAYLMLLGKISKDALWVDELDKGCLSLCINATPSLGCKLGKQSLAWI